MFTKKEMLAKLWRAACKFEGIPEDSKFVIFSDDNKAIKLLDSLMLEGVK